MRLRTAGSTRAPAQLVVVATACLSCPSIAQAEQGSGPSIPPITAPRVGRRSNRAFEGSLRPFVLRASHGSAIRARRRRADHSKSVNATASGTKEFAPPYPASFFLAPPKYGAALIYFAHSSHNGLVCHRSAVSTGGASLPRCEAEKGPARPGWLRPPRPVIRSCRQSVESFPVGADALAPSS